MAQHVTMAVHEVETIETLTQVASAMLAQPGLRALMRLVIQSSATLVGAQGGMYFDWVAEEQCFRCHELCVRAHTSRFRDAHGEHAPLLIRPTPGRPSLLLRVLDTALVNLPDAFADDGFVADFGPLVAREDVFRTVRSVLALALYDSATSAPIAVMFLFNKQSSSVGGSVVPFASDDEHLLAGVFSSLAEEGIRAARHLAEVRALKRHVEQILAAIDAVVVNFGESKALLATNKAEELRHLLHVADGVDLATLTCELCGGGEDSTDCWHCAAIPSSSPLVVRSATTWTRSSRPGGRCSVANDS